MGQTVTRPQLARILAAHRERGDRIVFTNGCFDLLHIGHARYLAEAKTHGDVLVVGVNSDESVRRLKGPTRPLIPEAERAEMLTHLGAVDYVTIFGETTADALIDVVQPSVYVKGGDVKAANVPEAPTVAKYGGRLVVAQHVDEHSTSNIISKVVEVHDA